MKLKNIISSAITFLLCVFLFSSCEEKEKVWTELPPATQTGANTIGCLVDGQLWATGELKGNFFQPKMFAHYVQYKPDSIVLDFYAIGRNGSISFQIKNPVIGLNYKCSMGCDFSFRNECKLFSGDQTTIVFFTKIDLSNHILSGIFDSIIYCEADSLIKSKITDGRFDMYLYVN